MESIPELRRILQIWALYVGTVSWNGKRKGGYTFCTFCCHRNSLRYSPPPMSTITVIMATSPSSLLFFLFSECKVESCLYERTGGCSQSNDSNKAKHGLPYLFLF